MNAKKSGGYQSETRNSQGKRCSVYDLRKVLYDCGSIPHDGIDSINPRTSLADVFENYDLYQAVQALSQEFGVEINPHIPAGEITNQLILQ